MKTKCVCLILALTLCAAFAYPTAAAELKNPQTLLLEIPEIADLQIIAAGVYDTYGLIRSGNLTDLEYFFYLDASNPTISFSCKDVPVSGTRNLVLPGYEPYKIETENGFGMAEIFVDRDGNPHAYWENVPISNCVRVVFLVYDNLLQDPFADRQARPISELTMGASTKDTEDTSAAQTAVPTSSAVVINGESIGFDAYNIEGSNYFKLRDIAFALRGSEKQFNVGWDAANNAISLTSGQPYTAIGGEMQGKSGGAKIPVPTSSKILLDGAQVSFAAYNIEGNNYFMLRDIGKAFNFSVEWEGEINTILIRTDRGYPTAEAVDAAKEAAKKIFDLTNEERAKVGLPPFLWSEEAYEAAQTRANELLSSFSHTRPDGSECFTALDDAGIRYISAAENIAMGYHSAEAVVEGWVNSPGHYGNMMSDNIYLVVGVKDKAYVQLFYTSMSGYGTESP